MAEAHQHDVHDDQDCQQGHCLHGCTKCDCANKFFFNQRYQKNIDLQGEIPFSIFTDLRDFEIFKKAVSVRFLWRAIFSSY